MMIFSVNFSKTVSKRYVLIFQKRRYVQKIYSIIFKSFKIYVQRNFFNDFFQCLFKKYVKRFFEIYIFLCTFKRIFQWFYFCLNAYIQRISQEYVQTSKWKYVQKVLIFSFSKFRCVESEILGNHWIH